MRFCHEPLVREIGQPLPTFTTLNKLTIIIIVIIIIIIIIIMVLVMGKFLDQKDEWEMIAEKDQNG